MTAIHRLLFLALASCLSAACAPVEKGLPETPPAFDLVVSDTPESGRFLISLKSKETFEICLSKDSWPSQDGTIPDGGDRVALQLGDGTTIRAQSAQIGHCLGGCGLIRVPPGGELSGWIGYSVFGETEHIRGLPDKKLVYTVGALPCEFFD